VAVINRKNAAIARGNAKAEAVYQAQVGACAPVCPVKPVPPTLVKSLPNVLNAAVSGPVTAPRTAGRAAPVVSPEQAAYQAVAKLKFPGTTPRVGPSPDLNRWKMVAVGYPLWLWSDGPTRVGPVAQTVADLSVSLDARVSRTDFQMGDGESVSCAGAGTEWTSAVQPGEESDSCGYTYTQPSLPTGNYTVTATTYWKVTWTVNNTTGVITVPRTSTTQLPVGELQVLTR